MGFWGQERYLNAHVSQGGWPVLVLNADFRPLSYYPLSLWSWQDAVKAVFLDRVNIVANYDHAVHSPSFEMNLPSVVSLKSFVQPTTHPAFTRFNVFLRDRFSCQYCGSPDDLTFDHVVPRSRGGQTTWENVVAACSPCNLRKGNMTMEQARMHPRQALQNDEVGGHADAEQEKRIAVEAIAQPLQQRQSQIFADGERVDIARAAPVEVARRRVMLGMFAPPKPVWRERQHAHATSDEIIDGTRRKERAVSAIVLDDESAHEKPCGWQRKKQGRPIGMLDGREHGPDHEDERHQRCDELLDCESRHRATIGLTMSRQPAHALLLAFRHDVRNHRAKSRSMWIEFGTALRAQRLLEAQVQDVGPPKVDRKVVHS